MILVIARVVHFTICACPKLSGLVTMTNDGGDDREGDDRILHKHSVAPNCYVACWKLTLVAFAPCACMYPRQGDKAIGRIHPERRLQVNQEAHLAG